LVSRLRRIICTYAYAALSRDFSHARGCCVKDKTFDISWLKIPFLLLTVFCVSPFLGKKNVGRRMDCGLKTDVQVKVVSKY